MNKIIIIILVLLLIFTILISKHKRRSVCENFETKIPKVVHQTFSSTNLPDEIRDIMEKNRKKCSECEFKFYTDSDCDLFIKNNFNKEVYEAYKKINPIYGAMKADFFRYCILFKEGGIYLDVKSSFLDDPFKYIKEDDICILDIRRSGLEPWRKVSTYEQWLLIFEKGHPYLSKMIDQMVYYIENKFEPKIPGIEKLNTKQKILNVTGPDAFTKVIDEYTTMNNKIMHRNLNYDKIALLFSKCTYKIMYNINGAKHYSDYDEPLYVFPHLG